MESNSKKSFEAFLSSIYTNNSFKTKIEKEFEVDKNVLLFAKEFNITDLAFRNKFKDNFGITPKKWQIIKKLEKAKSEFKTLSDLLGEDDPAIIRAKTQIDYLEEASNEANN